MALVLNLFLGNGFKNVIVMSPSSAADRHKVFVLLKAPIDSVRGGSAAMRVNSWFCPSRSVIITRSWFSAFSEVGTWDASRKWGKKKFHATVPSSCFHQTVNRMADVDTSQHATKPFHRLSFLFLGKCVRYETCHCLFLHFLHRSCTTLQLLIHSLTQDPVSNATTTTIANVIISPRGGSRTFSTLSPFGFKRREEFSGEGAAVATLFRKLFLKVQVLCLLLSLALIVMNK